MLDALSDLTDFRDLRYSDIENAYQLAKFDQVPMFGLAIMIAVVFSLVNIGRSIQEDLVENKQPELDLGTFVKIIKAKWYFILVISLMPVASSLLEGFIGWVSEDYIEGIGEPNASLYDALKKQAELLAKMEDNDSMFDINLGEFVLDFIDYILVFTIQPAIVFYIESAYSAALVFRFFFHGVVELVGGVAIACLLNKDTEKFFWNWLKAVLISYLMIPIFLFANTLTDIIYAVMLQTDVYSWIFPLLLLLAGIKTILFTSVPVILFRVL